MSNFHFIENMKKIQGAVLDFIESATDTEENYENLQTLLKDEQIVADRIEFKIFLSLLTNISNYHFRDSLFNSKIE